MTTETQETVTNGEHPGPVVSIGGWIIAIMVVWGVGWILGIIPGCSRTDSSEFPSSTLSYSAVNRAVGCSSPYSDEKKEDLFNSRYRNKWYRWTGKVVRSESSNVSLDLGGASLQEIDIELDDKDSGYNLIEGQTITVRFLLDSLGGCIIPFGGVGGRRALPVEG